MYCKNLLEWASLGMDDDGTSCENNCSEDLGKNPLVKISVPKDLGKNHFSKSFTSIFIKFQN
jgi:hypothetical protein